MQIQLNKVLNSIEALRALASKPIPASAGFVLSKLFVQIESEISTFENTRVKLLEKYGSKKEDGSYEIPEGDSRNNFTKELNELLNMEIHLNYEPLPISKLGDVNMPISDMVQIQDFFTN